MNKVCACEFVNKVKRSLMEKIIILKSNHVTGKVDDYLIMGSKTIWRKYTRVLRSLSGAL